MFKNINRLAELYKLQKRHALWLDGKLWVGYQRMVVPAGPAHLDYSLPQDQVRVLLKYFPGCVMVRYTTGFETSDIFPWYAVICDNFVDLVNLSANNRSKVRRGLKNCVVEIIDADYLAQHGYEVYASAFERYKDSSKPGSEKAFKEEKNYG